MLVERELAHYEDRTRISAKEARHEVWRASYDGETCVLKEYRLDDASEWKLLAKEVRLLGQLAHPHIATVDAVFVQQEPTYAAYVQLPYFSGGDMLSWLRRSSPPDLWRRYLNAVRQQSIHLARAGRIEILRKGKPADPNNFKGVYRLRLKADADG